MKLYGHSNRILKTTKIYVQFHLLNEIWTKRAMKLVSFDLFSWSSWLMKVILFSIRPDNCLFYFLTILYVFFTKQKSYTKQTYPHGFQFCKEVIACLVCIWNFSLEHLEFKTVLSFLNTCKSSLIIYNEKGYVIYPPLQKSLQ